MNHASSTTRSATTGSDQKRRALVVGLGVAGISSAIALHKAGWQPVIVEKSPQRRQGGYFITLMGLGKHGARHLGYLGDLHSRRGPDSTTYEIDRQGNRTAGLGFADFPGDDGPWMMLRSDVERAGFENLPEDVEIRYSTRPQAITHNADTAWVTLQNTETGRTTEETYDLVVGADGIHSSVRRLAFGPHENYMYELGYTVCAFAMPDLLPGLKQNEGAILAEPGRSFWVFDFADHAPTVLFSFRSDLDNSEPGTPVVDRIRNAYGPEPLGETMEAALAALEHTAEFQYDQVEQVRMDHWHQGPVVLVGDSAWCPTLYSGMGASTAVGGADLLGQLLTKHPDDVHKALDEWESIMRPNVDTFQGIGVDNRISFTPADEKEVTKRKLRLNVMRRVISNKILGPVLLKMPGFKVRQQDLTAQI